MGVDFVLRVVSLFESGALVIVLLGGTLTPSAIVIGRDVVRVPLALVGLVTLVVVAVLVATALGGSVAPNKGALTVKVRVRSEPQGAVTLVELVALGIVRTAS